MSVDAKIIIGINGGSSSFLFFITTGGKMENIIHFCGIQLSLEVKVIFNNGNSYHLHLLFGPFRTQRDIKNWKDAFLDDFLSICLQIPEVETCVKSSESVEQYNPADKSIFRPTDTLRLAEEIVNLYIESEDGLENDGLLANRYYDWLASLRFDFLKQDASYIVDRSFGPFNDVVAFKSWWKKFKKGVRGKASELGGIRFRVLKGEFVEYEGQLEGDQEDDFYEIICRDPEMKGQEFFTEILKEWLQEYNSFG